MEAAIGTHASGKTWGARASPASLFSEGGIRGPVSETPPSERKAITDRAF
jgi:hypothetical protein